MPGRSPPVPAPPPRRGTGDPLPIDALLPDVVAALRTARAVVVEAPPGAGKTTRVPAALLAAGLGGEAGEILVLQPRRLPTRLAAERVAAERGEEVGGVVGYSVRFEDRSGPGTRLRFVTEGVLTRRLLATPTLPGVAAVVLDELHERHLDTDLALGLLGRLRRGARPDLLLAAMSATLDAEPVAAFLGGCPRLRSEGRVHPVSIEHLAAPDDRPLDVQVTAAVRRALREEADGDVLVFLPGAAEIRRAAQALAGAAGLAGVLVLPLHGDLPPAEQARAVRPADRRKVILSTNVAETSVTIDGVVAVVDSGLARFAGHSPFSGLPSLRTGRISQASAAQRAGRAGRTRPGRVLRLFTRHDFEGSRPHDLPEIARGDLAEVVLALHAAGVARPAEFEWFEPPPGAALQAAGDLLRRLQAVDAAGRLTEVGLRMLAFPAHPRLARALVEAERRGVGEETAAAAALLGERDVREGARAGFGRGGGPGHGGAPAPGAGRTSRLQGGGAAPGGGHAHARGPGKGGAGGAAPAAGADLLALADLFAQARAARFAPERTRALGLDARACERVERTRRQLASRLRGGAAGPAGPDARDEAVAAALLAGFPDRVARRRTPGGVEVVLAGGGAAELPAGFPGGDLVLALDAEERPAGRGAVRLRLAAPVSPEALLDVAGAGVAESDTLRWNDATGRVERAVRTTYGALVLEETLRPAPPSPAAGRLLAEAALAAPPGALGLDDALALGARLAFLRTALPEADVPSFGEDERRAAILAACEGLTTLADLREAAASALGKGALPPEVRRLLAAEAPERLRLPGGREVPVHYEAGKPPWIASRLQDFFGLGQGPRLARGRVPVTLHLLAPNQRAVQVTQDLAGFWERHYPALRRELGRRYPRHAWPEDPRSASPPAPRVR